MVVGYGQAAFVSGRPSHLPRDLMDHLAFRDERDGKLPPRTAVKRRVATDRTKIGELAGTDVRRSSSAYLAALCRPRRPWHPVGTHHF